MVSQFSSGGFQLACLFARPEKIPRGGTPGLLICHGFPTTAEESNNAALPYYELAERVAIDVGWASLAFTYRGCGESEGDFSPGGWLADIVNATHYLSGLEDVTRVYLVGFGTGGALAMVAAATDSLVAGVAAVSSQADFDDWQNNPEGLFGYARSVGVVSDIDFESDVNVWRRELLELKPVKAAEQLSSRPLLLLQGSDDSFTPVFDARVLADAHGAADLRIIEGAGHRLQFDPRAVAVLISWLTRVERDGI